MINPEAPVKGVIVAAGYGTRFLPVTKTVPKEMLPLVDTPSIQFIVDEFIASGIRDILVISSRRKKVLEDYFDREPELEAHFQKEGAEAKLRRIAPPDIRVQFIRQQEMKGTGHALLLCETFASGSPIVVAYPDDILLGDLPCARQLVETWKNSISPERPMGCTVLSVLDLPGQDVSRYGIVDPVEDRGFTRVRRMVEKPAPGTEPSHLISLGRYLYTPEIFPILRELAAHHRQGEFFQTEPINRLAEAGKVACARFQGLYCDTGAPIGYLKTLISYALTREDLRGELMTFLRQVTQRN